MRKPKVPDSTVKQLGVVAGERAKQDAEWGVQDHALDRWSTILAKQHGAMAQAIIAGDAGRVYAKAKQVAAVAVAVMEMVARTREVVADTLPVEVASPQVPMPLRLKELADAFALIYSETVKGEYVVGAGDREGARKVLTAADGDTEKARAWMRWFLRDNWYGRKCPTLASMGKQINAVRVKAESTSGGMTDELWRGK